MLEGRSRSYDHYDHTILCQSTSLATNSNIGPILHRFGFSPFFGGLKVENRQYMVDCTYFTIN